MSEAAANDRQALLGAWRLQSVIVERPGRECTHPFGDAPHGQISYGADNHMSAHLVKGGLATGESVSDYTAYFGRFSIDPERGVVTHHVDGASHPPLVGVDQPRAYKLEGDRLTLSADRGGGRTVLVWRRLRPALQSAAFP